MSVVFEHNIEYLLAFIPAILGMSLPILLQVIERIDQKYKSSRLAERLQREPVINVCKWSLILALVTCAYTAFFRVDSWVDCWIINNSANLIALIFSSALVITFLWSCVVIMDYYNPEILQNRIIQALNKARGDEKKHLESLLDFVDLSKTILEVSDREPAYLIYDVLSKEIQSIISNAHEDGMVVPDYLANSITSINENLCLMKRRPYSINNGNQLLKMLISNPTKLSEDTYRLLWRNLLLQLHYNADEWVYEYWTAAVQTYDFDLQRIFDGMYAVDGETQYTQEDVDRRLTQRQRFLEFHVVLCSYILNLKKYDLLDKLFWYTQEMPPTYPLIPSTLSEIIAIFRQIDESPRFGMTGEQSYPFLGMKGIVDGEIKGAVKRYLSLLYLRLFSAIGIIPDFNLVLPNELRALKLYDSYMESLKWFIARIKDSHELNTLLNIDEVKIGPAEEIERIKSEINCKIEEIRENGELDEKLANENKTELKEYVVRHLTPYKPLVVIDSKLTPDAQYWIHCNVSNLYPNSAFMRNSDESHFGMAEKNGADVIGRFQHKFASVFYQTAGDNIYRISSGSVFEAFDKLQINHDHVIVAFNIYWDYYINAKQKGLVKKEDGSYAYKDVTILNLPSGSMRFVDKTLFVLRKEDMPVLSFEDMPDAQIEQYRMEKIEDEFKLYASLIQLSQHNDVAVMVNNDLPEVDIKDKTLFGAFLNAKVLWSKYIPILQLKLMYSLGDNGRADDIDKVTSFQRVSCDMNLEAQRAESLAKSEIEKELGLKLSSNVVGLDGVGEKDGKTIYFEAKYFTVSRDSIHKAIDQFRRYPRVDNSSFYIALVSKKPIPATTKQQMALLVKEKYPGIELRFYSFYQ